ncbi:MAG: sulfotransferase [Desulfobacterales bacterium]|jgi:hypothetical protein
MKKPNLFIVGHPRTGTSALHDALDQHPDIFMSIPKEPVYFAKDLHAESDLFHKKPKYFHFRSENQYLKIFKQWAHEKIAGESTAVYLYSKKAAREIHTFNSEAKIIMVFREPVSWLSSYHAKAIQIIGENQPEIKEAVILENERKKGHYLSEKVMAPSMLYYSDFIKFYKQIKRYTDLFDTANIKIIIYDDFKTDNPKIYKEILEFLEVDHDFSPRFKKVNISRTNAKWPIVQHILQYPYLIKLAIKVLPRNLFSKLSSTYWESFFEDEKTTQIDADFRFELMHKFKPEVHSLSEFLNRDLIKLWGYDKI